MKTCLPDCCKDWRLKIHEMFRDCPAPGQCPINISGIIMTVLKNMTGRIPGQRRDDNKWREPEGSEGRQASPGRLTLCCSVLALRPPGILGGLAPPPRAVPSLSPAAPASSMAWNPGPRARVGHGSSCSLICGGTQKDWRPGPLRTRRVEGWSHLLLDKEGGGAVGSRPWRPAG